MLWKLVRYPNSCTFFCPSPLPYSPGGWKVLCTLHILAAPWCWTPHCQNSPHCYFCYIPVYFTATLYDSPNLMSRSWTFFAVILRSQWRKKIPIGNYLLCWASKESSRMTFSKIRIIIFWLFYYSQRHFSSHRRCPRGAVMSEAVTSDEHPSGGI